MELVILGGSIMAHVELPFEEARAHYLALKDSGNIEGAARIHREYYEAHRVRLSKPADGEVPRAIGLPSSPAPDSPPGPVTSRMEQIGVVMLIAGALLCFVVAQASGGPLLMIFFASCAGVGFTLLVAGVIERRLIEIKNAIEAGR